MSLEDDDLESTTSLAPVSPRLSRLLAGSRAPTTGIDSGLGRIAAPVTGIVVGSALVLGGLALCVVGGPIGIGIGGALVVAGLAAAIPVVAKSVRAIVNRVTGRARAPSPTSGTRKTAGGPLAALAPIQAATSDGYGPAAHPGITPGPGSDATSWKALGERVPEHESPHHTAPSVSARI